MAKPTKHESFCPTALDRKTQKKIASIPEVPIFFPDLDDLNGAAALMMIDRVRVRLLAALGVAGFSFSVVMAREAAAQPPPQQPPPYYPQQQQQPYYPPPQQYPYPQQQYPQQQYPQQQYPQQQQYSQYSPYPQQPPPPPPEEPKHNWYESAGLIGIRGTRAGVSGGDAPGRTYGLMFWLMASNYGALGNIGRTRTTFFGGLGGGSGGFEGGLGGSMAIGARIPVDPDHGPLARIGFDGHIVGNDLFYHSWIQFPQLQIAYQILSKEGVLEIGFKGAPVLDGRLNVGNEARRRLGASFGFSGYATYQEGPIILDFDVTRILAERLPGTPVDTFTFDACLAFGIGICFDARFLRGDVVFGSPLQVNETSAAYLGLSLGIGGRTTKIKK